MSDRGLPATDAGSKGVDTRNVVSVDSVVCVDSVDNVDSVDRAKWGFNRRICVAVYTGENKHFFVSFLRQQNHSEAPQAIIITPGTPADQFICRSLISKIFPELFLSFFVQY